MGATQRVTDQIQNRQLEPHVLALETTGYTVLKGVLSASQIERAIATISERAEQLSGKPVDLKTGEGFSGLTYIPYLLYDDEVFEDILMLPEPLALMTYLLGESCLLSSMGCHFKGPGGEPLALHSDNGNGMPAPFPAYSQVANMNYALTPYTKEAGALAMVPGSHRFARAPNASEMQLKGPGANPRAIAMEIDPGDCVIWHGNTWHGSFERTIPGVRMNLAVYFCRQYLQTQEQHKGVVPANVMDRQANNERFRVLLGEKQPYGWKQAGPDYSLMARNPRGHFD